MKFSNIKLSKKLLVQAISLFSILGIQHALAEDIKVGMSAALSGPTAALGTGVQSGIQAYFNEVNSKGGVQGQMLKLVTLDDGYEPDRAGPNMATLIDQEKVISVIGNVGTPTAVVTVPIANEKKTLLFGAFTGAGLLRKSPADRYIINYRASYAEETSAMVKGLLANDIKPEEIAFFTQNDGYGDAGYSGAVTALKESGFDDVHLLVHGRYARNTVNVEGALATLLDAEVEPKAVIMVGAYAPCAKFISLAKEDLPDTLFLNVSFVGSAALLKALGDESEGVIVTQVVPHPESDLPGVKEYQAALKSFDSKLVPDFVSLEGYLAAEIFVEGLKKSTALNREAVIDGLLSLGDFDLGIGETLNLSPNNHQASHKVWPTIIKDGKYVALDWNSL